MRKENDSKSAQEQAMAIGPELVLHPAFHFDHPSDVLAAEKIGSDEKRAILASWASDISAIESMPALRRLPGVERAVSFDEILDALKALDSTDQCFPRQPPPVSFDPAKNCPRRTGGRSRENRVGPFKSWKGGYRRPLLQS
ncbi:hypothetical protein ABK249_33080 [Neorhizobium sp. Rsf11]|uniref:Uncharacterized protein n=1 Tax=Neorhizobium phenanthreniclasticum TaxID=3157917 RepID=A0ABV0MCW2_9HYPH